MSGTAPILLLSMPQMADPNFSQTVVLLCDFTEKGAFGLVVGQFTWWLVLGTALWMEFLLLIWLLKNIEFLRRFDWVDRFFPVRLRDEVPK